MGCRDVACGLGSTPAIPILRCRIVPARDKKAPSRGPGFVRLLSGLLCLFLLFCGFLFVPLGLFVEPRLGCVVGVAVPFTHGSPVAADAAAIQKVIVPAALDKRGVAVGQGHVKAALCGGLLGQLAGLDDGLGLLLLGLLDHATGDTEKVEGVHVHLTV